MRGKSNYGDRPLRWLLFLFFFHSFSCRMMCKRSVKFMTFSVWDIKLNLSGLSQHQGHVWSYVRAYQCVEDVGEIPLFQRHVLHSIPLPSPLCPQERPPAVFLVFIEQEVDWTGWPGSVFRRLVAETGLGPEPIVLYLATTEGYFCYCCLILSDIVKPQRRNVCALVCVFLL